MRYGRGILREGDWKSSRCTSAPKTAGEKLDGGCQAFIFVVAADARGQGPTLVALLTIVTKTRSAGNASAVQGIRRRCRLVRAGETLTAAISLVSTSVGSTAVCVEHICLWWRGSICRACTIVLLREARCSR